MEHLKPTYPSLVPVPIGVERELVTHRELRNTYCTNRSIKVHANWYLLRALTQSCKLQRYRRQMYHITHWLQMSERTFYRNLAEWLRIGLVEKVEDGHIFLASYRTAAELLNIPYSGNKLLPYNPTTNGGKQIFQYFLRAEEIRANQQDQASALRLKLDNNPSLKICIHHMLHRHGADNQRLHTDPEYFRQQYLRLQRWAFREGSEILGELLSHRADINRGVRCIQQQHQYKSSRSVSYLKKRMATLGIIQVSKVVTESPARSRIYVPDPETGRQRDGYKWIPGTGAGTGKRSKGFTAWFLTDQISIAYEPSTKKYRQPQALQAAA